MRYAQQTLARIVDDVCRLVRGQRSVPRDEAQQDRETEFSAGFDHVRFDRSGMAGFTSA